MAIGGWNIGQREGSTEALLMAGIFLLMSLAGFFGAFAFYKKSKRYHNFVEMALATAKIESVQATFEYQGRALGRVFVPGSTHTPYTFSTVSSFPSEEFIQGRLFHIGNTPFLFETDQGLRVWLNIPKSNQLLEKEFGKAMHLGIKPGDADDSIVRFFKHAGSVAIQYVLFLYFLKVLPEPLFPSSFLASLFSISALLGVVLTLLLKKRYFQKSNLIVTLCYSILASAFVFVVVDLLGPTTSYSIDSKVTRKFKNYSSKRSHPEVRFSVANRPGIAVFPTEEEGSFKVGSILDLKNVPLGSPVRIEGYVGFLGLAWIKSGTVQMLSKKEIEELEKFNPEPIAGQRHGREKTLRPDGTLVNEFTYKMGVAHGLQQWFDKDEKLEAAWLYYEGQIFLKVFPKSPH